MSAPERLVVSAAVGTAARPLDPETLPEALRPPGVEGRTPAATLLEAGALHAVAARAGAGLVTGVVEPPDLAAEGRALPSQGWATAFRQVVGARSTPVAVEALRLLAERGMRVPPNLVVDVLAMPVPAEWRGSVPVEVLGERGQWVQSHEPFGPWELGEPVVSDADEVWELGTRAERATWLARMHRDDAARARVLLDAAWEGEDRAGREVLLGALAPTLTAADDALLERALDDRSADVRALAQELLPGISGTAYAARMVDRMAACTRRGPLGRIRFEFDGVTGDDRDGIPDPGKDLERALARIVAGVPLDAWPALVGRSAAELVGREVGPGLTLDRGLAAAGVRARDPHVCAQVARQLARTLRKKDAEPDPIEVRAARWAPDADRAAAVLGGLVGQHPQWIELLDERLWPTEVVGPVLHAVRRRQTNAYVRVFELLLRHGDVTGPLDLAGQVRELAADKDFAQTMRSRAYATAMLLDLRRTLVLELKGSP